MKKALASPGGPASRKRPPRGAGASKFVRNVQHSHAEAPTPSRFRRSSEAVERARILGAKKSQRARTISLGFKKGPHIRVSFVAMLGVLALVGAFVVPPLFNLFDQMEQARSLHRQLEEAKAQNVELRRQVQRWSDPAYMASQARQRLGYVKKGETQFVVVDPGKNYKRDAQIKPHRGPKEPWFMIMSETTKAAGKATTPKRTHSSGRGTPQEGATQAPKEDKEAPQ